MRDGMITEEQCGENFAYILEDKTDFLITEYKMMHGQEADFLLKCVKMLYNGKTEPVSYTHLDVYKRQGLYGLVRQKQKHRRSEIYGR